jgi:hypothetical protein
MKKILTLFMLLSFMTQAQKNQLGFYVPVDIPNKNLMPNMSVVGGFGMSYAYQPFQQLPISFEVKGNLGSYASKTIEQTFQFEDLSTTRTDVSYTSSMHKSTIGAKFTLGNNYSALRGFVTPQIGYAAMRSRIRIADPEDEDDCQPLENKIMKRHSGYIYGGEVGLEYSLDKLFKNSVAENKHRVYISASYIASFKPFEYINIKHMKDGHYHEMMNNDASRDLNVEFMNVSTESIHEHKIAELYRSNIRMWGINFGYIFTF